MNVWQTVITAIAGNTLGIAALGFLCKSLLENILARDMKVFELELKAKADAEIERLKNEMTRSLESYKVQFRKSEVFFGRELEAALALSSLFQSLGPRFNHPDMDWSEACDQIALVFDSIENDLHDFAIKHAAFLKDDETELLNHASSIAGEWKFHATPGAITLEANHKADELYRTIEKLSRQLLERVQSQSSQ